MKHREKDKYDLALFHEFLIMKGETRQIDELTAQEMNGFFRVPSNSSQNKDNEV